jgi:hypothetical protein
MQLDAFGKVAVPFVIHRLFRPKWCSEQTAISLLCSIRIDQWLPSPRPSGSHRSTALALVTPVAGANCVFRYSGNRQPPRFNLLIFFAGTSQHARSVQQTLDFDPSPLR